MPSSPHDDRPARHVIILGATGSIGTQALDVIDHLNRLHAGGKHPVRHEVVGLAARNSLAKLRELARPWPRARLAVCKAEPGTDGVTFSGPDAPERLVREVDADVVVAAIVGVEGLAPTLAAAQLGRDVALANKETLVAAGAIVTAACRRAGARLLPVDSEHAAAWQCLRSLAGPGLMPPASPPLGLQRLILTASGGAFRDKIRAEVEHAPPEAALDHPNWTMGAKVTIDSATLINKGLELIEAHWLYGLPADRLDAIIHRQSAVHALAETVDRGLIAHLAAPDMRLPIQAALTAPAIATGGGWPRLDLASLGRLDFAPIDPDRFPIVSVALGVIERGGSAGAVFNAAAEVAVEAYLAGRLPFGRIDTLTAELALAADEPPPASLDEVLEIDRRTRAAAAELLAAAKR